MKVSQDDDGVDEFMVTRLESVIPALNIVNIYGCIENRTDNDDILESWSNIKKELSLIEMRGEAVLILGDLNRAVGNDENGVRNNKTKVSYGGGLVRDLVDSGSFFILNNLDLAEGGPWTREDPSDGSLSCLDLAIGSANLKQCVVKVLVDQKKEFTPYRAITTRGVLGLRYTDHLSLILELKMKSRKTSQKTEVKWNTSKPGGWNHYNWISNLKANKIKDAVENENDTDTAGKKLDKIDKKIRFAAFGKTKIKNNKPKRINKDNKSEEETAKETQRKESEKIEKEFENIKKSKQGRAGKVFKMREVISGPKKQCQEAIALKDSRTGELVVSNSEIKRVTSEYCEDLFNNNSPDEGFEEQHYIKNKLHEEIMKDTSSGKFEAEESEFWRLLDKCRIKNKRSYDWLIKAGKEYQEAIFSLVKRMIEEEDLPEALDNTLLIQLHKSGSFQDLKNSRFLHIKDFLSRITEGMVVGGMKEDILMASTKFQIGGQPGMRSQFHLFVLKSIIKIKENSDEGNILTVGDIEKFFDKEGLIDTMLSLEKAKIDHKCYRLWYKLNKRVVLTARTGVGNTDPIEVDNVVAQGSSGASLASGLNIDIGVNDYFNDSTDEVFYGRVRLQPLLFCDDLNRLADNVRKTRAGLIKLDYVMKEKMLTFHPLKSVYMVYGSLKYKQEVEQELEANPLMLGDITLKKAKSQKYLGDILHEDGLKASVAATVKDREGRTKGSIYELRAVCTDFRMQILGGMVGAIDIWEAAILPSLLHNSGTWVDISEETLKKLDSLQNLFVQVLLKLPHSTPLPALRGVTGLLGMKWRIWREKLMMVDAIRKLDEDTLAKEMFDEQIYLGLPGLTTEVQNICKQIGVSNICQEEVTKEEVEEAIRTHHLKALKIEMEPMKKCKDIKNTDMRKIQTFLTTSNLEESCIGMRIKTYMIKCAGNMSRLYRGREECIMCILKPSVQGPNQWETQDHMELCSGYEHLKIGRDLINFQDKISFFTDALKLREETVLKMKTMKMTKTTKQR